MSDTKKDFSFEEHLKIVHQKYLQSTPIISRKFSCGRELFLNLGEVFELIKFNEFPPRHFHFLSLDNAVEDWDIWQLPPPEVHKDNLSIKELFHRGSPKNPKTSFLHFCKEYKVIPRLEPGDFYFNFEYDQNGKEKALEIIQSSEVLSYYLLQKK